jgi:hypothetical protein
MLPQATISSKVRKQPLHKLVGASIWHNEMQGDGIAVILIEKLACSPSIYCSSSYVINSIMQLTVPASHQLQVLGTGLVSPLG